MPKLPHEALVRLVRAAPAMVVDLLRSVIDGLPEADAQILPQVTAAELVNLDLPEFRADAVLVLGDADAPIETFILEVQGEPSARKRRTWPLYVTGFEVRHDCPATLVIFALDDDVAEWCSEPIVFSRGRGRLHPVVLRPRHIPRVTDPAVAAAAPELAVLSVAAHGREPGAEHIARVALEACYRLDTQARHHYADFIIAFLGQVARAALGKIMQLDDRNPYFSEEFRQSWAGGWAEGIAEGKAEGEALGEARTLLRLLRLRGWTVAPELEAQVVACRDDALFEKWTARVLTAASLDEVFA
ncbi:MAG: hypothetical protein JNL82_24740 [Myxococcales bacterium]|nr:hypothetical protein [Myxococcales bacterium]